MAAQREHRYDIMVVDEVRTLDGSLRMSWCGGAPVAPSSRQRRVSLARSLASGFDSTTTKAIDSVLGLLAAGWRGITARCRPSG